MDLDLGLDLKMRSDHEPPFLFRERQSLERRCYMSLFVYRPNCTSETQRFLIAMPCLVLTPFMTHSFRGSLSPHSPSLPGTDCRLDRDG